MKPKFGLSQIRLNLFQDITGMLLAAISIGEDGMKAQYVGDINDYKKYALLRALADGGKNKIGVCWMLTADDDSSDGSGIGYLFQPKKWRQYDPNLFDILRSAIEQPEGKRLGFIESSGAISGASYFNDHISDDIHGRSAYFVRALHALSDAEIIFLDPDNGLEVPSIPKGRKHSSKYLYGDEVALIYGSRCSLLVYQHFPRENRERFVRRKMRELSNLNPAPSVWAIRTPNVVFFLVAQPFHAHRMASRLGLIERQLGPKVTVIASDPARDLVINH